VSTWPPADPCSTRRALTSSSTCIRHETHEVCELPCTQDTDGSTVAMSNVLQMQELFLCRIMHVTAHRSARPTCVTTQVMTPFKATTKTADTMASVVAMAGRAEGCTMPAAKLKRSLHSNSSAASSAQGPIALYAASMIMPCSATRNTESGKQRQFASAEAKREMGRHPVLVWRVAAAAKPNWKPRLMPQTTSAAAAAGSSFKNRRQPRC
jgi:hypothetical protein